MKLSVVVPAYNEEKLIVDSLRAIKQALAAFTERNWTTELIVSNNNSTDRTAELAAAEGAHVVFEPVNQISRARNAGAAAATGDWIIFVDADSYPSRELFADAAEKIESGRYLAGGVTVKLDEGPFSARCVAAGWSRLSRIMKWAAGSFIFCRADAFRKVGGFSLELFASEEIDLSIKLKKLARSEGKRLIILHKHPLITSGRKLKLYTRRDHLRLLVRGLFRPFATVKSREACQIWYDGRR
ncbi:MAG: glycosyltransferase [Verrucomicrobia bacterium]|nr:glycosyltransferase [Verrucomicrobiota bacterium]